MRRRGTDQPECTCRAHLADDERIYAYRAFRFARGDATELPGFDQDRYVEAARAERRSIDDLLDEHEAVRAGTLALFASFSDGALARGGVADGAFVTASALGWHITGHELYHLAVLRRHAASRS